MLHFMGKYFKLKTQIKNLILNWPLEINIWNDSWLHCENNT